MNENKNILRAAIFKKGKKKKNFDFFCNFFSIS